MPTKIVLLFACVMLLFACGRSTPTNFYALSAPKPLINHDNLPKTTLRIARVNIPHYLDRDPIVTRKTDRVALGVDSVQIWAEPLADGVRRILHDNLSPKLLAQGVTILPLASDELGNYTLLVDVLTLDAELANKVDFSAQWSLHLNNQVVTDGIFSAEKQLQDDSYKALVQSESELVCDLAQHILSRIQPKLQKKIR